VAWTQSNLHPLPPEIRDHAIALKCATFRKYEAYVQEIKRIANMDVHRKFPQKPLAHRPVRLLVVVLSVCSCFPRTVPLHASRIDSYCTTSLPPLVRQHCCLVTTTGRLALQLCHCVVHPLSYNHVLSISHTAAPFIPHPHAHATLIPSRDTATYWSADCCCACSVRTQLAYSTC